MGKYTKEEKKHKLRERDAKNKVLNEYLEKTDILIEKDEKKKLYYRSEAARIENNIQNSESIIEELAMEFKNNTVLTSMDMVFLFFATALQCTRIYILNQVFKVEKAGTGEIEQNLKETQKEMLSNFDDGRRLKTRNYYAPLSQIVTTIGVPYDAQAFSSDKIKDMYLFKGANHRFSTLGHDPIMGLVFGTANIVTNTITTIKTPIVTTCHVSYDLNYKNPTISSIGSTVLMLEKVVDRVQNEPSAVVAAVIKQLIHIGTDMYTPCGISLPFGNVVLSNRSVEEITRYISTGDVIKFGTSASIAMFINVIIETVYMLSIGSEYPGEIATVKCKKMITYANVIASSSNVIQTYLSKNIKNVDLGGIAVTIYNIFKNEKTIKEIKDEFIFGGFEKTLIMNPYNEE